MGEVSDGVAVGAGSASRTMIHPFSNCSPPRLTLTLSLSKVKVGHRLDGAGHIFIVITKHVKPGAPLNLV